MHFSQSTSITSCVEVRDFKNRTRGIEQFLRQRDLLLDLLNEGIPARAAIELCRVFEQETIVPWRIHAASTSSAPPVFDLEECQRRLRADKQRKATESS